MPAIVPTPSTRGVAPTDGPGVSVESDHVMSSPFVISLSDSDRAELTARAHAAQIPYRDRLSVQLVAPEGGGPAHSEVREPAHPDQRRLRRILATDPLPARAALKRTRRRNLTWPSSHNKT